MDRYETGVNRDGRRYRDEKRRRRSTSPERYASVGGRRSRSGERENERVGKRTHHHREPPRSRSRSRSRSRRTSHPAGKPRDDGAGASHRSRRRSPSRSRSPKRRRRSYDASPSPVARSRKPLATQEQTFQKQDGGEHTDAIGPVVEKQKPNFKPTGLLAAETNKVTVGSGNDAQAIVLKYHEPPEARKPPASEAWSLYVFKGESADPLRMIPLHTRSCWLLGRESAVADVLVEHPSCSKQHAVFQFRYIVKKDEWGERRGKVRLYVLDLESANGTLLNGARIDGARYVECRSGDVVKFGDSEREYVLLLPPKESLPRDAA